MKRITKEERQSRIETFVSEISKLQSANPNIDYLTFCREYPDLKRQIDNFTRNEERYPDAFHLRNHVKSKLGGGPVRRDASQISQYHKLIKSVRTMKALRSLRDKNGVRAFHYLCDLRRSEKIEENKLFEDLTKHFIKNIKIPNDELERQIFIIELINNAHCRNDLHKIEGLNGKEILSIIDFDPFLGYFSTRRFIRNNNKRPFFDTYQELQANWSEILLYAHEEECKLNKAVLKIVPHVHLQFERNYGFNTLEKLITYDRPWRHIEDKTIVRIMNECVYKKILREELPSLYSYIQKTTNEKVKSNFKKLKSNTKIKDRLYLIELCDAELETECIKYWNSHRDEQTNSIIIFKVGISATDRLEVRLKEVKKGLNKYDNINISDTKIYQTTINAELIESQIKSESFSYKVSSVRPFLDRGKYRNELRFMSSESYQNSLLNIVLNTSFVEVL